MGFFWRQKFSWHMFGPLVIDGKNHKHRFIASEFEKRFEPLGYSPIASAAAAHLVYLSQMHPMDQVPLLADIKNYFAERARAEDVDAALEAYLKVYE